MPVSARIRNTAAASVHAISSFQALRLFCQAQHDSSPSGTPSRTAWLRVSVWRQDITARSAMALPTGLTARRKSVPPPNKKTIARMFSRFTSPPFTLAVTSARGQRYPTTFAPTTRRFLATEAARQDPGAHTRCGVKIFTAPMANEKNPATPSPVAAPQSPIAPESR